MNTLICECGHGTGMHGYDGCEGHIDELPCPCGRRYTEAVTDAEHALEVVDLRAEVTRLREELVEKGKDMKARDLRFRQALSRLCEDTQLYDRDYLVLEIRRMAVDFGVDAAAIKTTEKEM